MLKRPDDNTRNPEAGVTGNVSCSVSVQRTELRSSPTTVQTSNCQVISCLDPIYY